MLEATHRTFAVIAGTRGTGLTARCARRSSNLSIWCQPWEELLDLQLPRTWKGLALRPFWLTHATSLEKCPPLLSRDDGDAFGQGVRTKKHSYMEFDRGDSHAAPYDLEKDPWGAG